MEKESVGKAASFTDV